MVEASVDGNRSQRSVSHRSAGAAHPAGQGVRGAAVARTLVDHWAEQAHVVTAAPPLPRAALERAERSDKRQFEERSAVIHSDERRTPGKVTTGIAGRGDTGIRWPIARKLRGSPETGWARWGDRGVTASRPRVHSAVTARSQRSHGGDFPGAVDIPRADVEGGAGRSLPAGRRVERLLIEEDQNPGGVAV